jgi:hypothetical protein
MKNYKRFNNSAARMAMPGGTRSYFMEGSNQVLK